MSNNNLVQPCSNSKYNQQLTSTCTKIPWLYSSSRARHNNNYTRNN